MVAFAIVLQSFLVCSVQSLYCTTPIDCTNTYNSINLTADTVRLDGYKSGTVDGSITTTDWLYCNAAFSCIETPLITTTTKGNIALRGTQSGFNSSITSATSIDCAASNSCSYSSIRAADVNGVYCQGDQACSYSTLTAPTIQATGAYALKNATINSVAGQLLKIYFRGYHSGFGAKIVCQDSHSCVAYCYGNSCDYLRELQCVGNNPTCLISYNQAPDTITSTHILLFDSFALTTINNVHCKAVGSIAYDNRREHYNQGDIIVDAAVVPTLCCRGIEACRQTNIEYNGTLICSGYEACHYNDFIKNYNGDIFCGGRLSCSQTIGSVTIESRKDVYCTGYWSCQAHFISSGTIYCTGMRSCWNSIINSTGDGSNLDVYFTGRESMDNVRINCKQNDVCRIVQDVMNDNDAVKVYCDGVCSVECPSNFNCPIIYPTSNPTTDPTLQPTMVPTYNPTFYPTTMRPTFIPTVIPTVIPTNFPSIDPTVDPTVIPTFIPTFIPTLNPTHNPTSIPLTNHTYQPTSVPTDIPTINPTFTYSPSDNPTTKPTINPTINPTPTPVSDGNAPFETTVEGRYSKGKLQSENNSLITFITDNMLWLLIIIIGFLIVICVLLIFCCKRKKQSQIKHKAAIINTNIEMEKVQSIEIMSDHETEPGETNTTQETNENTGEMNDTYSNKNALKYWLNDIGMNEYFDIFVKEGFGDDISQMEALLKLTNDQLKSIGVNKLAHRNLILSKIEKLNISSQIENRNENDYLLNNSSNNIIVNTNDDENEDMYMEKELETKGVISVSVNANDDENEEMYVATQLETNGNYIQKQTENNDSEKDSDDDLYKQSTKSTK